MQNKKTQMQIITGCLNKECSNFIKLIIGAKNSEVGVVWLHDGSKRSEQILQELHKNNIEELEYCFTYPFMGDELKEHVKNNNMAKKRK